MRTSLFAFRVLCFFFAPAPSASSEHQSSGLPPPAASTSTAGISAPRGQEQLGMPSTALDFREMMRKERELAMKKLAAAPIAPEARYLSKRQTRLDLKRNHRVTSTGEEGGIDGIYYVPGFVTGQEARGLEKAVRSGGVGGGEWKDLYKRRLQIHGGTPHPSGMVQEELPSFLREVCDALVQAGIFPKNAPPNHVLLNEYSDGQGIGPHKDGPLYEGRVAILSLGREAILDFWGSLEDARADCADIADRAASGNAARASATGELAAGGDFACSSGSNRNDELSDTDADDRARHRRQAARRALVSVKCEDCSLVVFEGQAYHDAWHGIVSTAGGGAATAPAAEAETMPPTAAEAKVGTRCEQDSRSSWSREAAATRPRADDVAPSFGGAAGDGGGGVGQAAQKRLSFTIRRVARVVSADSVMEHSEARSEMERRRRVFEHSVTETGGAPLTNAAAAAKG